MSPADPLGPFRQAARDLSRAHKAGEARALARLQNYPPRRDTADLTHSDYLQVIAMENGFRSWSVMQVAVETQGLDHAQKRQRLGAAMHQGSFWLVDQLLSDTPDLADGSLALQVMAYDRVAVEAWLSKLPALATQVEGFGPPLVHLCRSKMIHHWPDRREDMLVIADLLLAHGADVNAGVPVYVGSDHLLPPLYFALGHGDNMALSRWLLAHGADPNDQESLYHSTELGHHQGLKLLLEHGADPKGTNALLRAMDFHDHLAVELLLSHGARADEFNGDPVGGEAPFVTPALVQAARRGADLRMIELLLGDGVDVGRAHQGASPYAYARVYGNGDLAVALEAAGASLELSPSEALLAAAAQEQEAGGQEVEGYLDPNKLPEAFTHLIRDLIGRPEKLGHIKRLVAIGMPYDTPDGEGLTPVQVAGWEGLPEALEYLLKCKPDLGHINGYGGTLLSTILHGSEHNPAREGREYLRCLELVLQEGVALPRRAAEMAGDANCAAFLADWAEAHPGQVVEHGVA